MKQQKLLQRRLLRKQQRLQRQLEAEIKKLKRELAIKSDLINSMLLEEALDQHNSRIISAAYDNTIDAVVRLHEEKPAIIKGTRSESARNAAAAKYPVTKTDKALAGDFHKRRADEPNASDWQLWGDMAEAYGGGRKKWKRIRNAIRRTEKAAN